jgi:hypothetical protein
LVFVVVVISGAMATPEDNISTFLGGESALFEISKIIPST